LLSLDFPLPFDRVKPEHVRPAFESLLAQSRARIEEIAAGPPPLTWESLPSALDRGTDALDLATVVVSHLESVMTSPELRGAWNETQPQVAEFYSSLPLHTGLWNALQSYAATQEAQALTGVRARFLKKTLDGFRRHGAALDETGKARLRELDVELAKVTIQYAQNVVDATAAFEHFIEDESKLAGLPESAIAAARESAQAKEKPGWRFTLQQPSYLAVMTYLDDASVRRLFWEAYNQRAAGTNLPLIPRILELRRAKAQLLGFANFADFVLVERMAKDGATALAFERDLRARTEAAFQRENAALLAFRRQVEGANAEMLPWDVGYWAEQQRKAEYDFDEEDLRPYFPLAQVLGGLFQLVQRLFGVTVREAGPVPVWHPDVKYYEVHDESGTLLGSFYADWFPRDNKRGGAWMNAFYTGGPTPDGFAPHVGLMCGNLTPPLADKPSLLTHREAETIFHEFGHLLHHLLSQVEVKSLAGTHVPWDFVELPSQIMENWCWERESLDLFARHWETGATVPEELFAKMRRARTFRGANAQMRQLGFGTLDLCLHTEYDPATTPDLLAYVNGILRDFAPAPLPQDYAMIASFTHLFADAVGYGAGYYSYKWAEVLDADAFTRFQKEGVFNRETGRAFRDWILSRGDSEEPAALFRGFMGRDPDPNALLTRLGLLA
jgi:oligopeptidase A